MDFFETIKVLIMAIVQGIGEFLPISSSGHLLVLGKLFFSGSGGLDEEKILTLNILLHAGTLLSILIVFRRWIWEMLTTNRRLILLIIVGSIPTGAIGLVIEKKLDFMANSLWVTGVGFLLTGLLLWTVLKGKTGDEKEGRDNEEEEAFPKNDNSKIVEKTLKTMTWFDAIFIGVFQGIAVLPGLSRSGLTISAGMMRKIRREDAAVLSFLMAIPAIGGATLLKCLDYFEAPEESFFTDPHFPLYMMGTLVSLVIGILSLVYLMKWLRAGKLHYFAFWLFLIGPAVLIWQAISLWLR